MKSEPQNLQVKCADEVGLLARAKTLHAQIYLKHGYVTEADLTSAGFIGPHEDPYQDHAQYFLIDRIVGAHPAAVAVSRLILAAEDKGLHSFQTYIHREIEEPYRRLIEQTDPRKCAEVSALVKAPGENTIVTLLLYRAMWQYGLTHGHKLWLVSCDARLYDRLAFLFGPALTKIGPTSYFKGHHVVPALLHMDESLKTLLHERTKNPLRHMVRRRLINFMLRGLPPKYHHQERL